MGSLGRDAEKGPGRQRHVALGQVAIARAGRDDADANRRMGVARLVRMWRNVQVVETGIAQQRRAQQQAVGTAVDIAQAPFFLEGAAQREDAVIAQPRGDPTLAPAFDQARAGHAGEHARRQREAARGTAQRGAALEDVTKVGVAGRQSLDAITPDRECAGKDLVRAREVHPEAVLESVLVKCLVGQCRLLARTVPNKSYPGREIKGPVSLSVWM